MKETSVNKEKQQTLNTMNNIYFMNKQFDNLSLWN